MSSAATSVCQIASADYEGARLNPLKTREILRGANRSVVERTPKDRMKWIAIIPLEGAHSPQYALDVVLSLLCDHHGLWCGERDGRAKEELGMTDGSTTICCIVDSDAHAESASPVQSGARTLR